ncbi:hypothetical protein FNL39_101620 [Nocardia caishijiensis]|uniref:Uncharacterized protein n=1 Tax=Nocardia caishijiensis TaxID=184756 RepID=A0ABQ6YU87_9NOCA|nr:hypothetical protein FNL39_101620 [Nocardia caishijiensis]
MVRGPGGIHQKGWGRWVSEREGDVRPRRWVRRHLVQQRGRSVPVLPRAVPQHLAHRSLPTCCPDVPRRGRRNHGPQRHPAPSDSRHEEGDCLAQQVAADRSHRLVAPPDPAASRKAARRDPAGNRPPAARLDPAEGRRPAVRPGLDARQESARPSFAGSRPPAAPSDPAGDRAPTARQALVGDWQPTARDLAGSLRLTVRRDHAGSLQLTARDLAEDQRPSARLPPDCQRTDHPHPTQAGSPARTTAPPPGHPATHRAG